MNTGDKIVVRNVTYRIGNKLGSGGQGSVWEAENISDRGDKKKYAVKKINETNKQRLYAKTANIKKLIETGNKLQKVLDSNNIEDISYALPLGCADVNGEGTVYVMRKAEGETLNEMLLNGRIRKMPVKDKLIILRKIAKAIDILHVVGYFYTDINWGNFKWDSNNESMCVIDCENMACSSDIDSGKCAFLIGTGFFIDPMVAFKKANVGRESDRYALATLIFRVLTNNVLQSAYHGKAMFSAIPACQNMTEVAEFDADGDIDPNWRKFVFDPDDRSNGLDDLCKNSKSEENRKFRKNIEDVIKIWKNLDERLKRQFLKTFKDPFAPDNRTSASLWVSTIDDVLNVKATTMQKPCGDDGAGTGDTGTEKPRQTGGVGQYKGFGSSKSTAESANNVEEKKQKKLPDKPYLISSGNIVIPIRGNSFTIEGKEFGMGKNKIGVIEKVPGGYMFTSLILNTVYILNADGSEAGRLAKNQSVKLKNGQSIRPSMTVISVKLVY